MQTDNDLIALVEKDLGPGRKYGRWVMFRCPFHHPDRHPSFGVTNGDDKRGPMWRCFSAACGRHGGPVGWLMEYHRMSKAEAISAWKGGQTVDPVRSGQAEPVYQEADHPPAEAWQRRAWEVIERAEAALWGDPGGKQILEWPEKSMETGQPVIWRMSARDWLLSRGLTEKTLKDWRVGFIPVAWKDKGKNWGLRSHGVYIAQGVLIPCIIGGAVWYLKIRRPMAKPKKYIFTTGSKAAGLYMAKNLEGHKAVVFCEGELDALLLCQEAGDLAGIVTLGSAGTALNVSTWGLYLLHTTDRYTVFDTDQAGEQGAAKLDWMHPRNLQVPQLRPGDKDLTDFVRSGGNLRQWLLEYLFENTPRSHQEGLQGPLACKQVI